MHRPLKQRGRADRLAEFVERNWGGKFGTGMNEDDLFGSASLRNQIPATLLFCKLAWMSQITQILEEIEGGNAAASEHLLPLVYAELRSLAAAKLAREKPGLTLDATALVHEAYLRLLGPEGDARYDGRGHFFAAAAEAMRRLLVERARRYQSQKHGGGWNQVELSEFDLVTNGTPDQIDAVDEAMEELSKEDPAAIELVKLVVFAGMSVEQAGKLLDMSRATAFRHWAYARAFLKRHMTENKES